MPRYHFHLSAPDNYFRDQAGVEVSDLSAAHLRAVQLADRVLMVGAFARCEADLRRWTVQVTDADERPVMTVIFPAEFEKRRAFDKLNGARTLQARLATRWNETCAVKARSLPAARSYERRC
jgi:hypothetical protein